MHDAERIVTAADGLSDDADRKHVQHLIEGLPLPLHLLVDAVEVFGAPDDSGIYFGFGESFIEELSELF